MTDCLVLFQVWSVVFPHALLQLCCGLHASFFLPVRLQDELPVRITPRTHDFVVPAPSLRPICFFSPPLFLLPICMTSSPRWPHLPQYLTVLVVVGLDLYSLICARLIDSRWWLNANQTWEYLSQSVHLGNTETPLREDRCVIHRMMIGRCFAACRRFRIWILPPVSEQTEPEASSVQTDSKLWLWRFSEHNTLSLCVFIVDGLNPQPNLTSIK